MSIPLGRYRHYKGKDYTVLGLARHSETEEELVVYRQEYAEHGLWVRPATMFLESVKADGREIPRFQYLGPAAEPHSEGNLFHELPDNPAAEIFQTILSGTNLRIERIVSQGQASPEGFWYDQVQHEWVILLRGAARLRFEADGKMLELKPGDFVNIPAHCRHRLEWTSAELTVWLAVHYEA